METKPYLLIFHIGRQLLDNCLIIFNLSVQLCVLFSGRHVIKDAFLPPHLYGQLVQKKHGFKRLQKTVRHEAFAASPHLSRTVGSRGNIDVSLAFS